MNVSSAQDQGWYETNIGDNNEVTQGTHYDGQHDTAYQYYEQEGYERGYQEGYHLQEEEGEEEEDRHVGYSAEGSYHGARPQHDEESREGWG